MVTRHACANDMLYEEEALEFVPLHRWF